MFKTVDEMINNGISALNELYESHPNTFKYFFSTNDETHREKLAIFDRFFGVDSDGDSIIAGIFDDDTNEFCGFCRYQK